MVLNILHRKKNLLLMTFLVLLQPYDVSLYYNPLFIELPYHISITIEFNSSMIPQIVFRLLIRIHEKKNV